MSLLLRSLLLFAFAPFLPSHSSSTRFHAVWRGLSSLDQRGGWGAAQRAAHSPAVARDWISEQSGVRAATLGRDGATLDISFKDGARVVVLPKRIGLASITVPGKPPVSSFAKVRTAQPARAIVLEPFAEELGQAATVGQSEAKALSHAGFRVDRISNANVTVNTMAGLSRYSMVYMETHSGVLNNGDAVVTTGESDAKPYASLYAEHSLVQTYVAGDSTKTLYNSITSTFVLLHMTGFHPHSIVFVGGCSILSAPVFWDALRAQNVGALVSWDLEVDSNVSSVASNYVVQRLAKLRTVSQTVMDAQAHGLGASTSGATTAHLGFLGDGGDTLTAARTGVKAPAKHVKKACKRGSRRVHGKCRPILHK